MSIASKVHSLSMVLYISLTMSCSSDMRNLCRIDLLNLDTFFWKSLGKLLIKSYTDGLTSCSFCFSSLRRNLHISLTCKFNFYSEVHFQFRPYLREAQLSLGIKFGVIFGEFCSVIWLLDVAE